MEPRGTWKIRRLAQDEGDPGTEPVDPANPDVAEENLDNPLPLNPEVEAPVIGRFAYMNDLMDMAMSPKNQAMSLPSDVLNQIRQDVAMAFGMSYATKDDPITQFLLDVYPALAPAGDNPKDGLHSSNLDVVYTQMKSKYAQGNQEVESKFDSALATAKISAAGQDEKGKAISNEFAKRISVQLSSPNKQQMQASTWRKTRIAQVEPMPQSDPLSSQPFQSLNDLKAKIVEMGRPQQEGESSQDSIKRVYEKVFDMVGPEHEDRAKAALKSLYQFGIVCELWSLFQEIGLAAPIDQEVIGEIMQNNPDLFNQEKETAKAAGLFLPDPNTGLYTMPEAGLTKTASGGVGGAGAGYPAYEYEGSNRMCPKIRGVVNTFICRYHCLDGLKVDDAQVLCGEALWRQAVMDKFSREYKNEDGEWVGGYLNKRFEIHRDDGGHPYQLKPGRRSAPIHEDAWNYEKRLQEMRKAEGAKRGYGPVSGERDDLYNFDQHKLMGGPDSSTLSAKPRDPIAKNASTNSAQKTAAIPFDHPGMEMDSREGQDPSFLLEPGRELTESDVNEAALAGLASKEDFITRIDATGRKFFLYQPKANPGKQAFSKWSIKTAKKASFNLRRIAAAPNDAMNDYTDMGDKAKECLVCKKKFAMEYMGNCDNVQTDAMGNRKACGGQLRTLDDGTIKGMTGAIDGSDIPIHASNDIEVRYAAGVFVASRMGQRAYGESPSKAVEKLAFKPSPGFAPGQPKTQDPGVNVEELGDELRKEPEGQGEEIQGQEQVQAPMTTVDTTPTTDEVPMSKAPKDPFTAPAAPPPPAAEIEASAVSGPELAEGDTPAEKKKAEQELDDLYFGI